MLGVDNEALPVNTPLNKQAAVQLESIMQSDAETALQVELRMCLGKLLVLSTGIFVRCYTLH